VDNFYYIPQDVELFAQARGIVFLAGYDSG
jgi:hypothetical protein